MIAAVAFAFVAGTLTILAPCTLPVVPFVLASANGRGRRRTLGVVLGFGSAFVIFAVALASVLADAGLSTAGLRVAAAIALGLFGTAIAWPALALRAEIALAPLARFGSRIPGRGSGLLGGVTAGAAIGLIWAPCVGPLMAAVIAVAVSRGPTLDAVSVATAYAIGAAIPLLAIATWGNRAIQRLARPERRIRVQRALGALAIVASLLVVTGADIPVETGLAQVIPAGFAGLSTGAEGVPSTGFGSSSTATATAASVDASALPDLGPAPELAGITAWINSAPLSLAELRGKVVLVHFWTFDCINCIHVQPYVKAWYERYAAAGLVVIGVHTPELPFERELGNVRDAVARDGITFPVAFDPSFATWNAYHNRYWPAFYFVDKAGRIRHEFFGEGDYAGSERVIQELLAEPG